VKEHFIDDFNGLSPSITGSAKSLTRVFLNHQFRRRRCTRS